MCVKELGTYSLAFNRRNQNLSGKFPRHFAYCVGNTKEVTCEKMALRQVLLLGNLRRFLSFGA